MGHLEIEMVDGDDLIKLFGGSSEADCGDDLSLRGEDELRVAVAITRGPHAAVGEAG